MDIVEKSLKSLEFDKVKEKISNFARLTQSKDLCLNAPLYDNTPDIQRALTFTREAKFILDIPSDIPIGYVADIETIKKNSMMSYLSEEELIDTAKTLRSSRQVKKFLKDNLDENAQLLKLSSELFSDKEIEDKIFDTFDENMNIKQDATPELKGLFASLRETEDNLKKRVNDLMNSPEFQKHLQENIYTTRDDRIVFQVMASSKSKVPGIVHDVSATSKTFYIEPSQIVPLNNKIRETKSKIHAELIRILVNLTNLIKSNIAEISASEKILAQIDFHFAKARYAVRTQSIEPELVIDDNPEFISDTKNNEILKHLTASPTDTDSHKKIKTLNQVQGDNFFGSLCKVQNDKIVSFEKMRHPLLIDCVENVIANDFEIGKDYKSVIITGSNTGGKTVTLKTIGLFLLMTKSGMFLPCTMAKVYPFKKILADIGDDQNILQNLSTFSSHMTNIIDILNISDEETFVLLDEICAGTDPVEGSVLAQVILEKFAQKNAASVVTTHYGELKSLEYVNPYFKNASVEFDTQSLKPTYRLLMGIPGLSNAISISSNLGLDTDITEKAKNILISQKDPSIVVVEKLQETQNKLTESLKEAEELKEASLKLKEEYEKNLDAIKKDKKKTIKTIKDKFDRELLSVKAEIKDILDELRREKSEKIARRSYARLAKTEQGFREKVNAQEEKQEYKEIDWSTVKPNDNLMLKELHQPVTVLSMPDKNGNVFVQMGNIKTKIKTDKLAPFDKSFAKKQNSYAPQRIDSFELRRINMSNTLDIRGFRVEDALDSLEFFLDQASLANLTPLTVIHGHGTGALKSAVRDFLNDSPYVAKWRPGENSEGGDGTSIIDIK